MTETRTYIAQLLSLYFIFLYQSRVDIDPHKSSGNTAHILQVVIGRKRQIGRAAAAIKNMHRRLLKTVEFACMLKQFEEFVDLRKLVLHAGINIAPGIHNAGSLEKSIGFLRG